MYRLIIDTSEKKSRERACINCARRITIGASDKCLYHGTYLPYWDLWDRWCKHWARDRRWDEEKK